MMQRRKSLQSECVFLLHVRVRCQCLQEEGDSMNDVPKETVKKVVMMLLNTKCDAKAWSKHC